MGIAESSARRGAETACDDAVHRVATRGAGPGSLWSAAEHALGKVCVPSSQTFKHDSLVLPESSWWPASASSDPDRSAGAWLDDLTAMLRGSCISRKQALATPEANANSHTTSTTNAVLRLVRVSAKNFIGV